MSPLVPLLTGGLLVVTALVLNPWTLSTWLMYPEVPDHILRGSRRLVYGLDGACLATASVLMAFRRRPWIVAMSRGLPVACMTIGALLVAWELAFPRIVRRLPLTFWASVPVPLDVLAQSSKTGAVPRDWVLLLGDSHAQGQGDWRLGASPWANPAFHSAHVLQGLLGRDMMTFARGGAGSIRGVVILPLEGLRRVRHRVPVDDPLLAILYFYEGNDFANNLRELNRLGYPPGESGEAVRPAVFFEFLARRLEMPPWEPTAWRLPGLKFTLRLAGAALEAWTRGASSPPSLDRPGLPPSAAHNRARIGGVEVSLPGGLQAPALDLPEAQIARAVEVFELSLLYLRRELPRTSVVVAYLPSVLSTYALASPTVSATHLHVHPARDVPVRSDHLARLIAEASRRAGAHFIDTRPALRRHARETAVHGPRDWYHFNRLGYTVLAHAVADGLRELPELARLVPPAPKEASGGSGRPEPSGAR